MDEKLAVNTAEIQAAMAAKRSSLRDNISHLEKEVEQKVLDTVDQLQQKVLQTTDEIAQKLTRPIHVLQEKIDAVPKALRSKPAKTLLTVAAVGVSLGFMLGRRGRHRYHMTRALLATSAPRSTERAQYAVEKKAAFTRGIFATLAMEAAHQILMHSLTSYLRRRD